MREKQTNGLWMGLRMPLLLGMILTLVLVPAAQAQNGKAEAQEGAPTFFTKVTGLFKSVLRWMGILQAEQVLPPAETVAAQPVKAGQAAEQGNRQQPERQPPSPTTSAPAMEEATAPQQQETSSEEEHAVEVSEPMPMRTEEEEILSEEEREAFERQWRENARNFLRSGGVPEDEIEKTLQELERQRQAETVPERSE